MNKYLVESCIKSGEKFIPVSSIEIEAASQSEAKLKANSMSTMERRKAGWDPQAGPHIKVWNIVPKVQTETAKAPKTETAKAPKTASKQVSKPKTNAKTAAKKPGRPAKAK